MADKIKVQSVGRQVLEGRLLVALDDTSKVAVVCSEEDLHLMIRALCFFLEDCDTSFADCAVARIMWDGLKQLKKEAFG